MASKASVNFALDEAQDIEQTSGNKIERNDDPRPSAIRDHNRRQSLMPHRGSISWFDEYIPPNKIASRHRSYSCQVTKEDILGLGNALQELKVSDVEPRNIQEFPDLKDDKTIKISDLKPDDLLVASTLVNDAKHGRHSDFHLNASSAKLYVMYHHFMLKNLLYLCVFVNLGLAVFEKPAVKPLELPYWVTMIIEFSCLLFYVFRFIHGSSFIRAEVFWSDKKNLILISTIFITIIDIIQYVIVVNALPGGHAIRFSRCIRPIFLVNIHEGRQIRRAFRNIRRTLPDILNVLVLFFLTIALFSLMALKLYQKYDLKYPNGDPYFTNYMDSFFDLYVLVTTANNPDVMMPAYDHTKWNALFFIAFIIIALYIFMSIILAVIYNNYRNHLKNEVKSVVMNKRQSLSTAFDLLKVKEDGQYILPKSRFVALLNLIPPVRSNPLINVLWFVLDSDGDFKIGKSDFLRLADLLNVDVTEVKDRKTILEHHFPKLFYSKMSKYIRKVVRHQFFRYFFDILIVVNAFLIGFDENDAEWFFLVSFSLEILLKMYTFGLFDFFSKFWNRFDVVVIGAAILASIVERFMHDSDSSETSTLDVILVLRVLRLFKIVGSIERFKVIVVTIANLGPSIITYGGILFIVYYVFAMVGMELFQNKLGYFGYKNSSTNFCGNIKLKNSDFFNEHYCNNNFNDILSSLVLLFELTVVNQWHVLTSGFVIVTSKAARLYFVLFHLICVIIILNIFTAFVLEAFIIEYSFSKGKLESAIETKVHELGLGLGSLHKKKKSNSKKIDKKELLENMEDVDDMDPKLDCDHDPNLPPEDETESHSPEQIQDARLLPDLSKDTDIRFHLKKGKKNVESMLQRMFENEIEEEGFGDDLDFDEIQERVERKLTL